MLNDTANPSDLPILVIGSAGRDMVGRLKSDLRPHTSNPAKIRLSYGGAARNVAENLLHLGVPVNFITVLGMDKPGDNLLQAISEAGADVNAVLRSSRFPTGTYIAVINPDGKLEYGLDDMRIIKELSPQHIRAYEFLFKKSSLLFIDANLAKETLRTTISLARDSKIPICADPTSQELAIKLKPYLKYLNLIVPNGGEAATLCDREGGVNTRREAIDAAKFLVGQGVEIAIVTMGELGVCYATSETSGYIPPVRTHIADPTGAGDALTAAVLFGLLNQIPIDDSVRLGTAAASLTLTYRGAVVPDLSLEKLYDQLR